MAGKSDKKYQRIEELVKQVVGRKLKQHIPETQHMPFHYSLLGRYMTSYSFVHSINTSLGISVFEQVAELLAQGRFKVVKRQAEVGSSIGKKALREIQEIIADIDAGSKPNKCAEIERIRKLATVGSETKIRVVKVDLLLQDKKGKTYLFDIKTAKPNKSSFKDYKRTLLEWTAIYLRANPDAEIGSAIAIPYNPYGEKQPYDRWTINQNLDMKRDIMVGEDFWDFVGGKGTYKKLLSSFKKVGKELKGEIDDYFAKEFS